MAGIVSHIRATQVRKRRATELSGAAREFKNSCDLLACASFGQVQHRRNNPCRHANLHSKASRTNPNHLQKIWLKACDAIPGSRTNQDAQ